MNKWNSIAICGVWLAVAISAFVIGEASLLTAGLAIFATMVICNA